MLLAIGVTLLAVFFREDSLKFIVSKGPEHKEESLSMIRKIYNAPGSQAEQIYTELQRAISKPSDNE